MLAIELLTAITHPSAPEETLSPETYFAGLDIAQRLHVVHEQLELLALWAPFFEQNAVVASVNIDGPAPLCLQHHPAIRSLIARLPWVRFELTEHHVLPQEEMVAQMPELGPLWLDDFGSGKFLGADRTEI